MSEDRAISRALIEQTSQAVAEEMTRADGFADREAVLDEIVDRVLSATSPPPEYYVPIMRQWIVRDAIRSLRRMTIPDTGGRACRRFGRCDRAVRRGDGTADLVPTIVDMLRGPNNLVNAALRELMAVDE